MTEQHWTQTEAFPEIAGRHLEIVLAFPKDDERLLMNWRTMATPGWLQIASGYRTLNRTPPGARNVLTEVWALMRDEHEATGLKLDEAPIPLDLLDPF